MTAAGGSTQVATGRIPARTDGITVIGVLNVTPDSFSDGGRYVDVDAAVEHGARLHAEGADLVDVGGESTRPGAHRIDAEEERRRVLPVITALSARGVPTSIDTYRASVAAGALAAGAGVINDVSGGLGDPDMARVARDAGCPWILMHWRGHSSNMQQLARYDDVVTDSVRRALRPSRGSHSGRRGRGATGARSGLGFAKTGAHNWQLLNRLDALTGLGLPVLVGASRKSFLGALLGGEVARSVDERESATTAITAYAALKCAWGVRVHDVRANVDAALAMAAIQAGGRS